MLAEADARPPAVPAVFAPAGIEIGAQDSGGRSASSVFAEWWSSRMLAGTTLLLKPNVPRQLGSRGPRPLPPEAPPVRNRGKQRTSPLWYQR